MTGCARCQPTLAPVTPRQGKRHFGVHLDSSDVLLTVFRGDRRVRLCREVVTGPGGWVVVYVEPMHLCPCGSEEALVERVEGDDFSV